MNSHHIDFLCWTLQKRAKPTIIFSLASYGVANEKPFNIENCEDSITINAQFEPLNSTEKWRGVAVFTAAWNSPKTDTHTQQRFYYVGTQGQIQIDQAHRGYTRLIFFYFFYFFIFLFLYFILVPLTKEDLVPTILCT